MDGRETKTAGRYKTQLSDSVHQALVLGSTIQDWHSAIIHRYDEEIVF